MTIAEAIYLLCALTSLVAAFLLLRQYLSAPSHLLFWSVAGFLGLAVNNVLVYVDLVVVTTRDLALARTLAGAAGLIALLYATIWESGS
jgi:hypothetical protein